MRIAAVKVCEESAERCFLCLGTGVGGLASDIQPTLVAYADRVGVVVQAVGAGHVLRTAWLDLSVTTDDVVVADAEVEAPLTVPGVDLSGRARLVGPHCRTVNNNQSNMSHTALMHEVVDSAVRNAVSAATMIFTVSSINFFFIIL